MKRRDLITAVQWEELANALHHVLLIGVKATSSDLQADKWYPFVGSCTLLYLLCVLALMMNNVFDLSRP